MLKAIDTRVLLIAVVALGTLALLPGVFGPPGPFDEGFVVSGAMMIRRGWLPIRDFFVIYGPGQYYLTAAAFTLFGEDLAVHRAIHVLTLALLGGVLAWYSFLVAGKRPAWLALMGVIYVQVATFTSPSAGYAAVPSVLLLVLSALGFAHWVRLGSVRHLLLASLWAGLAGLLRWDFGVFGVAALVFSLFAMTWARNLDRGDAIRGVLCVLGPWLAVMVTAFAPFVYIGDPLRWFNEVPRFAVLEFDTWRGVPFIAPQLEVAREARRMGDVGRLARATLGVGLTVMPFVLALATLPLAITRLRRSKDSSGELDALALVLAVTCLCLLNQMRVRPTMIQGFPAIVVSLPLAVYLLRSLPDGRGVVERVRCALPVWFAVLLSLHTVYAVQDKLRGFVEQAVEIDLRRASYMRLAGDAYSVAKWREYAALISYLRATTAEGEPILSAVVDMSRLYINDAMLYFLADRPSATRWIEMEPGLTNSERGQRELCAELERGGVTTLVLWDKRSNEPNATARSNDILVLDNYIRHHYEERQRFGAYVVFARRNTGGPGIGATTSSHAGRAAFAAAEFGIGVGSHKGRGVTSLPHRQLTSPQDSWAVRTGVRSLRGMRASAGRSDEEVEV